VDVVELGVELRDWDVMELRKSVIESSRSSAYPTEQIVNRYLSVCF